MLENKEKEEKILDAMVDLWVIKEAPKEIKEVVKEELRKRWNELVR